jgi:class 3 adenylate cyclase
MELPGEDHLPFVGDQDAMLDAIEEFLTGSAHRMDFDRVLATVMCAHASVIPDAPGDEAQRLDRFLAHARTELEWFRGRAFDMQPREFRSTFDGPARAIRCACGISAAAPRFGVAVRIGLHTGECDVSGDRVAGVAVDTCEQVVAHASSGEVLVSRTVKDLVAGSGLRFDDRGAVALESAGGETRLFAAERGLPGR